MSYEFFMEEAYQEALKAFCINETPVGCVIVHNEEIIARGHNQRNTRKNSLCHAEIIAINEACGKVGDWRLEECDLYVTVEPCPMCAGAIVQARINRVVFGAYNKKAGCAGSVINILENEGFNHQVQVVSEVLGEKCGSLMSEFFRKRRLGSAWK